MNKTVFSAEPGKQEAFLTREFDAPPELVFKAHVDPDLYVQWLGPRELIMTLDKFEPKTGGYYRYIHKDQAGHEHAFHGVYHDVTAPERIITTFEYEGMPESGHVILDTMKFEALPGGRTRLSVQSLFQSAADRDGFLQSGAEGGTEVGYQRLDELLAKTK